MIRHVLLDADGVVQQSAGDGWRATVNRHLGDRADEFVATVQALEDPCLTGEGDFAAGLRATVAGFGLDVDPEELYVEVWLTMEAVPDTLALVRSLRESGLGVHLVTNQHPRRAAHMKRTLGYGELFDTCFYSCDLGAAKPDPTFFRLVSERLGGTPDELLLVDDSRANVAGARQAGLAAEHWHHDQGLQRLQQRLAEHSVAV